MSSLYYLIKNCGERQKKDNRHKSYQMLLFYIHFPLLAIARVKFIAVVVACTALIILNFVELSSPNCCAILGTSLAASIMPSPNNIFTENVISPANNNVVCINAVRHSAATYFIHCVNPSE